MKTKVIILNGPIVGSPKLEQFQIIEEELPALKDGEFLVEAEFFSIDPYLPIFIVPTQDGKSSYIKVEQIGKITESKNSDYPVGKHVIGYFGWRTHTISDGSPDPRFGVPLRILPDYENQPKSIAFGPLGINGLTAYFGVLNVLKPKSGDTVVVTAAAGSVGITVGQIAKILGCYVVGITGSDVKGERLIKEANFDAFVNYKTEDFEKKLAQATPNRIDCYFDNVGGETSSVIIDRMNKFGRVAVCGAISTYFNEKVEKAREIQTPVKINHVRVKGFVVFSYTDQYKEALDQISKWIQEGKIKHFETKINGFENTPKAYLSVLKGDNVGKTVVEL